MSFLLILKILKLRRSYHFCGTAYDTDENIGVFEVLKVGREFNEFRDGVLLQGKREFVTRSTPASDSRVHVQVEFERLLRITEI